MCILALGGVPEALGGGKPNGHPEVASNALDRERGRADAIDGAAAASSRCPTAR